jgi:transposase
MLSKRLNELAQQKAKLIELEKTILAERESAIQRLHLDMGYATRADLIKALREADKRRPKRGPKAAAAKPAAAAGKKRRRAKVTAELRAGIEAAIRQGGTGSAIAKKFGVSLPTVQNIKRAAGLTRNASAAAPAPAAPPPATS